MIHNVARTLFKIIFVIVFIEASNIISIPIYRQISRGYVLFDLRKIGPILCKTLVLKITKHSK